MCAQYVDEVTLEEYFQKSPPVRAEDIQYFWRNLFDLIKALENSHKDDLRASLGSHRGVKPTNILVDGSNSASKFDVKFRFADNGLGLFTSPLFSRPEPLFSEMRGRRTYEAPQSVTESSQEDVQIQADIWALGCVYSEAVTWVVCGSDGIEEYRQRRLHESKRLHELRESDCFHDGEFRLRLIEEWHRELSELKRPTDQVTEPIWETMLRDMLGEAEERPNTKQLSVKARRILSGGTGTNNRLTQSSSLSAGQSQRSRRSDAALPSQYHGPQTPPESPYVFNARASTIDQQTMQFPDYRDRSVRLTVSRPLESTAREVADGEQSSTTVSPQSHTRSPNSFGRSSSAATASSIPPLNQPMNRLTQDSLAPRDILSGVSDPRLNSLGSAIELDLLTSAAARTTATSEGLESYRSLSGLSASPRVLSGMLATTSTAQNAADRGPVRGYSHTSSDRRSENSSVLGHNQHASQLQILPRIPPHATVPSEQIGTKPNPKAAPFLSVPRLHQWRQEFRNNRSTITITNDERAYLLPADKRDHVFMVDDASSMQSHWTDVTYFFGDFAYFIKGLDPGGLELCFSISLERKKSKNTKDLIMLLKKRGTSLASAGPVTSNLESRIAALLGEYAARLESEKAPHSPFSKKPVPVRPLTLYILTDGLWQLRCEVENPIKDLAERLKKLNLPRKQVGVQFVQFGQDESATRRLVHLDGGLGLERNIVDVEPFKDGNIWKMLNGSIDPRYKEPQVLITTSNLNVAELVGDVPVSPPTYGNITYR